ICWLYHTKFGRRVRSRRRLTDPASHAILQALSENACIANTRGCMEACVPASRLRQRSRVTIDEVAARAGVSISTVSRVLNRSVNVTEEATTRVLAVVAELGYVPQTAARHLAQGRTSTLGLLLPDIGTDFFSPLLRSINTAAAEAGYDLLVAI